MSVLLKKRRSRSESRSEINEIKQRETLQYDNENQKKIRDLSKVKNQQHIEMYPSMGRRKTSAEMISEAKTLLEDINNTTGTRHHVDVGGVRVVSTRRPITPREPGRALYGKVSMAGRPPSSFSLRYLQNEGNRTPMNPSLEPIKSPVHEFEFPQQLARLSRRSNSVDSQFEFYEIDLTTKSKVPPPRKLPSLEVKGVNITLGSPPKEETHLKNRIKTTPQPEKQKQQQQQEREKDNKKINKEINKTSSINILTSRKLLPRNYGLLAQSSTETLIELLKEHAGLKDCTEETVSHINSILNELYERVKKHEKNFKRGFILGGLYGLVECSSPKILLSVARVVLALRVTGSNLTGACKLIFKVARNEQNDQLFHENDLLELLIDGLGRASPLDDPEACIYGYGSIRFLTSGSGHERSDVNQNWSNTCLDSHRKPSTAPSMRSDNDNQKLQEDRFRRVSKQSSLVERLARHGAVELMVLHLQILNETGATKKLSGPPLHSLYQLSATLRALADLQQTSLSIDRQQQQHHREEMGDHKPSSIEETNIQLELACPHLVKAAEVSIGELDVQTNIVRTLSILSEDLNCCHVLANCTARIGMLLGPCCESFRRSSDKLLTLFSRLGYILGNIMSKYDSARIQFYHNDVAMEYLLNVLEINSKEPLTLQNSSGDTVIDVLIKMIRVVANMSVNSEVGFGLGNTQSLGILLLNLLNTGAQMKHSKLKSEIQELMHATLGALHNLCFYQDKNTTPPAEVVETQGSVQLILPDLATSLCLLLRTTADEGTQVETARVLGNLTRNEKARHYFNRAGGLPIVVQYLAQNKMSPSAPPSVRLYDLKACTIGILVNMLGDIENRSPFLNLKGPQMLGDILRMSLNNSDWFLATIVCQALWNLFIDMAGNTPNLQEQFLDDISDLLADYLDEERLFVNTPNSDPLWEDFAVVATDLLERIQCTYDKQSESVSPSTLDTSDDDGILRDHENDDDDVYVDEM